MKKLLTLKFFSFISFISVVVITAVSVITIFLYRNYYYTPPSVNSPVPAPVYLQPVASTNLYVRKNVVDLTPQEKAAFVNALKALKNTIPEGSEISIYDRFVLKHVLTMSFHLLSKSQGSVKVNPAHSFPAFLITQYKI